MILLIILAILLFGGLGGDYGNRTWGAGGGFGSGLGLVLLILILWYFFGGLQ